MCKTRLIFEAIFIDTHSFLMEELTSFKISNYLKRFKIYLHLIPIKSENNNSKNISVQNSMRSVSLAKI